MNARKTYLMHTPSLIPNNRIAAIPFDMLSGAGVTFKLIQALAVKFSAEPQVAKYLDIVAVGTIADIVPMEDENRIIAKIAFKSMMDSWNIGLRALIKSSRYQEG